jgi:hypothetical protein
MADTHLEKLAQVASSTDVSTTLETAMADGIDAAEFRIAFSAGVTYALMREDKAINPVGYVVEQHQAEEAGRSNMGTITPATVVGFLLGVIHTEHHSQAAQQGGTES